MTKLCPLLMQTMPQDPSLCACREERCAWWREKAEMCCVASAASDISSMEIDLERIAAQ